MTKEPQEDLMLPFPQIRQLRGDLTHTEPQTPPVPAPGKATFVPAATPVDTFLDERARYHGDFSVTADLAQCFKTLMYGSANWEALTSVQREALEQVATNLARILSGDPSHRNSYEDVIAYCTLVLRSIV